MSQKTRLRSLWDTFKLANNSWRVSVLSSPYLISLFFRLVNVCLTRTFFQPDEYWQSLEIAHRIVFGYGYLTWEWRPTQSSQGGIRSPLYPLICFVPAYWILKTVGLENDHDHAWLFILSPRLVQAALASACDWAVSGLAVKVLGSKRYRYVALFCSLTSFFHFYTLTRTFSNSAETTLTTLALLYWPWEILRPNLLLGNSTHAKLFKTNPENDVISDGKRESQDKRAFLKTKKDYESAEDEREEVREEPLKDIGNRSVPPARMLDSVPSSSSTIKQRGASPISVAKGEAIEPLLPASDQGGEGPLEVTLAKLPSSNPTKSSLQLSLTFAAIATIMRPSNAVIWILLSTCFLFNTAIPAKTRIRVLTTGLRVACIAVLVCLVLDTWFYNYFLSESVKASNLAMMTMIPIRSASLRSISFTPINFFRQNVFNGVSIFYGLNSWHFYATQAIPFMMLTQLPYFVCGIVISYHVVQRNRLTGMSISALNVLGVVSLGTVMVYSLLVHKEFRFLHPILPVLHLFTTKGVVELYDSSHFQKEARLGKEWRPKNGRGKPSSHRKLKGYEKLDTSRLPPLRLRDALFLLLSLVPALYLTSVHSLAQITVMTYLRRLPSAMVASTSSLPWSSSPDTLYTVGFLMPCHSTPWQSHLHRRDLEIERETRTSSEDHMGLNQSGEGDKAWFITCEPPVLGQNPTTYKDQSDFFYNSPSEYLLNRFPLTVDPQFPSSPFTRRFIQKEVEKDDFNSVTPFPQSLGYQLSEWDLDWFHQWPSHLIMFQALYDLPFTSPSSSKSRVRGVNSTSIGDWLVSERGYKVEKRFWNSHWHEDERRRGDVMVLRWQGYTAPED